MSDEIPTRQEMFNRAVRGLRAQDWRKAAPKFHEPGPGCQYLTAGGDRCAWGHVDPENTGDTQLGGTVNALRDKGIGLAALLPVEDMGFAVDLQRAHDNVDNADCPSNKEAMQTALRNVAEAYNLIYPED